MKYTLAAVILFVIVPAFSICQPLKIFQEKSAKGYAIYGENNELYPVSISLDLDLKNLTFSEGERKIFVVPAKTAKYEIGELVVLQAGASTKFSYKYKSTMGDVTITDYDKAFEYDLPFQKGKSFNVFQGYNGSFSHQNENSIDFTMPEGTEILAARDGVVVQVVQNNTETCPREECQKYNNYITIMHSDGTFATYAHIKYNGSKYKIGDTVNKGNVIAYSGNVGWSSGPHLHLVCYLGAFGKFKTIETRFKIDKGNKAVLLAEKNSYLRDY